MEGDFLTAAYLKSGLFAKIIDVPADSAALGDVVLGGVTRTEEALLLDSLELLGWHEVAATAIRWARLYGGALAVMLIDDGGGLEDPLHLERVRGVDSIHVYPCNVIRADGEVFHISSRRGAFTVHKSRCLTFRHAPAPEGSMEPDFHLWGVPELYRIGAAMQGAETAHAAAFDVLARTLQPVYKMQGLALELSTDEGESRVLRRLEALDMARGLYGTVAVDQMEDYGFRAEVPTGILGVVTQAENWLSAATRIPAPILWGRPTAWYEGGTLWAYRNDTSTELWCSFIREIQLQMVKPALSRLLSIIAQAEQLLHPSVDFAPLWDQDQLEQVDAALARAAAELTRARAIETYFNAGVLSPLDVRKTLKSRKKPRSR